MRKHDYLISVLIILIITVSCQEERMEDVELDTTPYILEYGNLPTPNLPVDNPLTLQGVELGRMLFYETMLSKDGTQACASCHRQADGFSDTTRFSIGVEMLPGRRQAMSVFNMAWHDNEFFWDGRSHLLRDQALKPIEDPLEMNESLENVILKFSRSKPYRNQFMRAFGSEDISSDKISLALEQFMLSIVSHSSKYDQHLEGLVALTDSEERGRVLFETEFNPFFPEFSGADCAHCHGGANFENDQYMNNGLDSEGMFADLGREEVTGDSKDRGKFKVPSLRNIALTPPYMHDGRFQTLIEVIDHYDSHLRDSPSIDPALIQVIDNGGLKLSDQDKSDLVDFLGTLTDHTLVNEVKYSSPF